MKASQAKSLLNESSDLDSKRLPAFSDRAEPQATALPEVVAKGDAKWASAPPPFIILIISITLTIIVIFIISIIVIIIILLFHAPRKNARA